MNKKVYVCTGGCDAEISQERYDKGLVRCGAKTCNKFGHPFAERIKCDVCGKIFNPSESHSH